MISLAAVIMFIGIVLLFVAPLIGLGIIIVGVIIHYSVRRSQQHDELMKELKKNNTPK